MKHLITVSDDGGVTVQPGEFLVFPKDAACTGCGTPLADWDGTLYVRATFPPSTEDIAGEKIKD